MPIGNFGRPPEAMVTAALRSSAPIWRSRLCTRFARVVDDDATQRLFGDLDLRDVEADTARRQLPGEQVALGDLQLLFLGIAGEFDDFHAVPQRRRYGNPTRWRFL